MIDLAILKFPLAILKMEKMRWLTRKYLQGVKVSCLHPEVHGCLKAAVSRSTS